MKALGTGHSQGVLWRDVEVVRAAEGRRNCSFTGAPRAGSTPWAAVPSLLTITHSDALALAEVIVLGR